MKPAMADVTATLTPTLSRNRERERSDAARESSDSLTPALSRNRERERSDAARESSDCHAQPVETGVTYPLSRVRERVGVRADVQAKARNLRGLTTEAETLLWQHLRGRRFQNFKFRRQRALGPYILDFICLEVGLVIEIDGGQHGEQQAYDQARTALIEAQGLSVIRFWNHEVMNETAAVLERIWQALQQTLTPTLSRNREREPSDAARGSSDGLTPTLSRNREREEADAAREISVPLTPTPRSSRGQALSRMRERESYTESTSP